MKTKPTTVKHTPHARVQDLEPRDRDVKGATESLSINYAKITYRQIEYGDQHKS